LGLVSKAGTGSANVIKVNEIPAKQFKIESGVVPIEKKKNPPPKALKIKISRKK